MSVSVEWSSNVTRLSMSYVTTVGAFLTGMQNRQVLLSCEKLLNYFLVEEYLQNL